MIIAYCVVATQTRRSSTSERASRGNSVVFERFAPAVARAAYPSSRVRDRPERIFHYAAASSSSSWFLTTSGRVGGGAVPSRTRRRRRPYSFRRVYHTAAAVPTNGRRRTERGGGRWRVAVKRAHCDREPRTLVRCRPGNVVRRTPKLGRVAHRRQCCYRVTSVRVRI